jgi:hypothetical protein
VTDDDVKAELARSEVRLELARGRVVHSVQVLRAEVDRSTDWRAWVARRPGTFLAVAFTIGFLGGRR